ncbi:MAG: hypothetical protein ACI3WQ_03985 [Faecousia sp.]
MRNDFCGWYFRCQSEQQTLAVIPSVHRTDESRFCAIQLITDTQSFYVQFPDSDFQRKDDQISIAGNCFRKEGISLDIHTPDLHATGSIRFGPFTPIKYDIMGPFRYVPFMQCRHSVYSMWHTVDGALSVNGTPYLFQDAMGYMEGDRGYSFPSQYAWTQCSFPDGALMLSIADIPLGGFHFTGILGIVLLQGKEYRLATYLGAKAVKIEDDEIIVRQGGFTFTVRRQGQSGHPLRAPVSGAMLRTIHEHPSCNVSYCFEENGIPLLALNAPNAAFEYEY